MFQYFKKPKERKSEVKKKNTFDIPVSIVDRFLNL